MKLGYVCTNFNNSQFTVEAVRSLVSSASDSHEIRVVVVDNQSSEQHIQTLLTLAADFPDVVEIVLNDNNVGYFAGLNCGIRRIRERNRDIDHLVIGNNDLLFPSSFCDAVEKKLEVLERYPVVSPDVVTLDGEHQNPHVIRSISKARELIYDLYYSNYYVAKLVLWAARLSRSITDRSDEGHYQEAQTIYQGHGSCYLIGPQFFKCFGELWSPSFIMGEEFFLSKQLSDQGMHIWYEPGIEVRHCCHGSLRSIPGKKQWQFGRDAHGIYRRYVRVSG